MAEKAILFDATRCTGCRGCQVACKQWNELPAETTVFFGGPGYQNPAGLSFNTYTVLEFHRDGTNDRDADGNWHFLKYQCMHCRHAACVYNCNTVWGADPAGPAALRDAETSMVYIDQATCRGCQVCIHGDYGLHPCPFGAPQPNTSVMKVRKCIGCVNRIVSPYSLEPACVKTCNTEALAFGDRAAMITLANTRLAAALAKWPDANIYGDDTGPYGGLGVISILGKDPSFYGLPPKSADWTDGRWAGRSVPADGDLITVLAGLFDKAERET